MTRKKEYTGALATPLRSPPAVVGSEDYIAKKAAYSNDICERLKLLMNHYQIDATLPSAWQGLAMRLAEDHVPGLRPWKPRIDTDRHVRIMLRMLYMTCGRGFSVNSAAKAVSDVCQGLGDEESVRSIYREETIKGSAKNLLELLKNAKEKTGCQNLSESLFDDSDPDFVQLRAIEKPKRGRPRKK